MMLKCDPFRFNRPELALMPDSWLYDIEALFNSIGFNQTLN